MFISFITLIVTALILYCLNGFNNNVKVPLIFYNSILNDPCFFLTKTLEAVNKKFKNNLTKYFRKCFARSFKMF